MRGTRRSLTFAVETQKDARLLERHLVNVPSGQDVFTGATIDKPE